MVCFVMWYDHGWCLTVLFRLACKNKKLCSVDIEKANILLLFANVVMDHTYLLFDLIVTLGSYFSDHLRNLAD